MIQAQVIYRLNYEQGLMVLIALLETWVVMSFLIRITVSIFNQRNPTFLVVMRPWTRVLGGLTSLLDLLCPIQILSRIGLLHVDSRIKVLLLVTGYEDVAILLDKRLHWGFTVSISALIVVVELLCRGGFLFYLCFCRLHYIY